MVEINETKMKKTVKKKKSMKQSWYFERLMRLINFWLNQKLRDDKGRHYDRHGRKSENYKNIL
jgi:hypothetical protein